MDKTYLYPNALRSDLRTNLILNADVSENTLFTVCEPIYKYNFSDYDISQIHDWECPSLSPHVLLICCIQDLCNAIEEEEYLC